MNPATASLIALLLAITLSIATRINVGLVAIGLAWLVGVYFGGLTPEAVVNGFPRSLFLTLAGVTLLFAAAESNGTLERLAGRTVRLARGQAALLPILFFLIAGLVSSVGPGSISSVALIVPLAMVVGDRAGVPHFLTALMVANGANAGNLSPVSAVGIIANTKMAEAGMGGHEGKVWFANLAAHLLVSVVAYFLLGGHRLSGAATAPEETVEPLGTRHRITLAVILAWIAGVLVFKLNLGLSAFLAITILIALRSTDERAALKRVPWGVIVMVCGVTVLIAVMEATGGMELFTTLLSRLANPDIVNGVMAFVTGAISTYSSTSGVVLPTFLPTVPGVIEKLGGGDPVALALSINIGSALVDVSPLSTLGALCVAAVPDGEPARKLFRQLMIWGISMTLVGALFAQVFAGLIARV
ncbi:MAG: SLC13 family permease [Gemmatimonadota bacterium]